MRQIVRYIAGKTYQPLLKQYLSKKRTFVHDGLTIEVAAGVFHPRFFFTTKLLWKYLSGKKIEGKKVLELGCGSGWLSLEASRKGASVTAVDINPTAVQMLKKNALKNGVKLEVMASNLFSSIQGRKFDLVLINPPFYKKDPVTPEDHAWYCGSDGNYFARLFAGLNEVVNETTEVIMVLSEDCDFPMINAMAKEEGWALQKIRSKKNLFETDYLFSIQSIR